MIKKKNVSVKLKMASPIQPNHYQLNKYLKKKKKWKCGNAFIFIHIYIQNK